MVVADQEDSLPSFSWVSSHTLITELLSGGRGLLHFSPVTTLSVSQHWRATGVRAPAGVPIAWAAVSWNAIFEASREWHSQVTCAIRPAALTKQHVGTFPPDCCLFSWTGKPVASLRPLLPLPLIYGDTWSQRFDMQWNRKGLETLSQCCRRK